VIWRAFRKSAPAPSPTAAWWQAALACEAAPTLDALADLSARMTSQATSPDEAERQAEMLDGLGELAALWDQALPVLSTQHRVIGTDVCHMAMPACLVGLTDQPGKVLLTSERLIHVGSGVRAWPWHRIGGVERLERRLDITILGSTDTMNLICNSYGDAMTAAYLARRLQR
jgi:hypothetical protein